MVCSQDDDHIVLLITDLPEPIGANLTGEYVAGMGDDNGNGFFNFDRNRILKEFFDGESQLSRGVRIELSRDSRFTNIRIRRFIRLACRSKTETEDKQRKAHSQYFHFQCKQRKAHSQYFHFQ